MNWEGVRCFRFVLWLGAGSPTFKGFKFAKTRQIQEQDSSGSVRLKSWCEPEQNRLTLTSNISDHSWCSSSHLILNFLIFGQWLLTLARSHLFRDCDCWWKHADLCLSYAASLYTSVGVGGQQCWGNWWQKILSLCVYVCGLCFLHSLTSNCFQMDSRWLFAADLSILSKWCLQSSWIFTPSLAVGIKLVVFLSDARQMMGSDNFWV